MGTKMLTSEFVGLTVLAVLTVLARSSPSIRLVSSSDVSRYREENECRSSVCSKVAVLLTQCIGYCWAAMELFKCRTRGSSGHNKTPDIQVHMSDFTSIHLSVHSAIAVKYIWAVERDSWSPGTWNEKSVKQKKLMDPNNGLIEPIVLLVHPDTVPKYWRPEGVSPKVQYPLLPPLPQRRRLVRGWASNLFHTMALWPLREWFWNEMLAAGYFAAAKGLKFKSHLEQKK